MKKIYQIPTTNVLKIELQQIMAGSSLGVSENGADPEGGMLSRRRHSVWDDDEDEDYDY